MCVTLVGAMLSMGSHYEGMVVHRKWENEIGQPGLVQLSNQNSTEKEETTSLSPLLSILKIAKENPDTNLLDEEEEDEKVSRSSSVDTVSTDSNQKDRKRKLFGGKSFSRGRINTVVKKTATLAEYMMNNQAEDNFKRWS